MVELHSNYTIDGFKAAPNSLYTADGTFPTNHAEHETSELTEGITSWSEVGFYVFTNASAETGYQWVEDHIRPRVRTPDSWRLPVGLSISTEVGYQRARFSPTPGPGNFAPSSTSKSVISVSLSTPRSTAPGTVPTSIKAWCSLPTSKSVRLHQEDSGRA